MYDNAVYYNLRQTLLLALLTVMYLQYQSLIRKHAVEHNMAIPTSNSMDSAIIVPPPYRETAHASPLVLLQKRPRKSRQTHTEVVHMKTQPLHRV